MDIMNVLGTAIGLVTVYLVLALSVTAINEGLAAMLSSRGKWLKKGVLSLLSPAGPPGGWTQRMDAALPQLANDPSLSQAIKLREAAYQSPFISHLTQGPAGQGYLPSYLPAWTLLQGLLHAASDDKDLLFNTLSDIETAAEGLPEDSPIRRAVLRILSNCNNSIDVFRKNFEAWFDEFEQQLIGWYRQRTHAVVLVISVMLALGGNVDTLAIMKTLSSDSKVREAVVKQGMAMASEHSAAGLIDMSARDKAEQEYYQARDTERAQLATASAGAPTASAPVSQLGATKDAALAKWVDESRKVEQQALKRVDALDASGLRLGWAAGEWDQVKAKGAATTALKLIGLLLSAAAITLGAPFWFDVLKNLVAIRSVGQNLTEQNQSKAKQQAT